MKKITLFVLALMPFFIFAEEKSKYNLQIYFVSNDINGIGRETFKIYDNDSDVYSKKILKSFKNLPKYRTFFLMPKGDMLVGGYFIVNFTDETGKDFSYTILDTHMAVRSDGMAFKYDAKEEFFEYFLYKYILETHISNHSEEEKMYYKAIFKIIDSSEFQEWRNNLKYENEP